MQAKARSLILNSNGRFYSLFIYFLFFLFNNIFKLGRFCFPASTSEDTPRHRHASINASMQHLTLNVPLQVLLKTSFRLLEGI